MIKSKQSAIRPSYCRNVQRSRPVSCLFLCCAADVYKRQGYGITDAYDKTYLNRALNDKLIKMPFDTVPAANSPNYVTSEMCIRDRTCGANQCSQVKYGWNFVTVLLYGIWNLVVYTIIIIAG